MRPRWQLWVQLAGLIATAWLVWNFRIGPGVMRQSLAVLATRAVLIVLVTWAASAIIAFLVCLVVAPQTLASSIWRSSSAAAWFAPGMILISTMSPIGLFTGFALVVNTARILVFPWAQAAAEARRPGLLPSFVAAFVLQSAWVASVWNRPMLAAVAIAFGCAVITALLAIRGTAAREQPRPLPPSSQSVVLTILLAAAISVAGFELRAFAGTGGGGFGGAGRGATEAAGLDDERGSLRGSGFPGVILRMTKKPDVVLIAPSPRTFATRANPRLSEPLTIPFTGEYWMLQFPLMRPPKTSILRTGSPLELSFHTTNGASMTMEARQRLAMPMNLDCCASLEVDIERLDQGLSISLDVSLIDSSTGRTQNLGVQEVAPGPKQALRYLIPSTPTLRQFDEIRIVYRRGFSRLNFSERVAIQRFVLAPGSR